jgi:hypothetical protein
LLKKEGRKKDVRVDEGWGSFSEKDSFIEGGGTKMIHIYLL